MKSCNLQDGACIDCGGAGPDCTAEATLGELVAMHTGESPRRAVRVTSVQVAALQNTSLLSEAELADLLPGEDDKTLIGNRIKALTTALGVPPCQGCGERAEWLNKAHLWLRSL